MFLTRYIIILLVFFGTLFYFREPIQGIPAKFSNLESSYSDSFKAIFKDILNATSTTLFNGLPTNYIPTIGGSSSAPLLDTSNTTKSNTESGTAIDQIQNNTKPIDKNTIQVPDGSMSPVTSNQQEESLTIQGIVYYTNIERTNAGLGFLAVDPNLKKSAESKLQDMFKNQYFQHISPSGEGVADGASKAGYEYIVVGENLALGVFAGDDQVVAAWMASPGHKKNILDKRFLDIGVAVGQGTYQGRKQWIIVQQFGKPLDSCDSPNIKTKNHIENLKEDIAILEKSISSKKAEIDTLTGEAYTNAASEYNTLVVDYNTKVEDLKKSIDLYNVSVRKFNECAGLVS